MASDQGYVDYIRDQAAPAVDIAYRKMFGEYALYLDGKVVALVCDNHLFVKPTAEGRALLRTVTEQVPYPRGKPHFLIDDIDDRELLQRLLAVTARALPMPRPKPEPAKRRRNAP
jgi:TfoX/Sxy family transcriptional regulator of competence genes